MPTCRRKRVLLTAPPKDLLDAAQTDANRDVYFIHQTGEIFDSYEAYAARMSFYKLKQFQCEVTGKSGLNYFQALESEQQESRTLHSRFPEQLKAAVLRSVQWQIMGRLDHLVELVYERYKDRYFVDEKVLVDVQGDKYTAKVVEIYPPKSLIDKWRGSPLDSDDSLMSPNPEDVLKIAHETGCDLSIRHQDVLETDDPAAYFYKVQIIEEDKVASDAATKNGVISKVERRESGRVREMNGRDNDAKSKWGGSLMEVQCNAMSRDRLVFSKSLLRRFLRECLDRDSSIASPWTVKRDVALRYRIPTDMPLAVKAGLERIRQDEIDKRRKIWEEKEAQAEREGIYTKKMQKRDEREAKAAAKAAESEAKQREVEVRAAAVVKAKEDKVAAEREAERIAMDKLKLKKKPVRYPTEDLDIRLTERDKKAGMKLMRPTPATGPDKLPFLDHDDTFENFIASWNFFMCYGQPLHLSSFTLDEYEHALRHSVPEPPCNLLAEVHSVMIYNLRTVPFERHSAVESLTNHNSELDVLSEDLTLDELKEALKDVGNNWERVPLKHSDGRVGWQDALIGCLKDHATIETLPRLRNIFSCLLFTEPELGDSVDSAMRPSRASPSERYFSLPPRDRIDILQFMCSLAISSKSVHSHLEHCEEQLTALRKEKIEINRAKKQFQEDMSTLMGDKDRDSEQDQPPTAEASDMESDIPGSEETSEAGSNAGRRTSSSIKLRIKAQQGQARLRELARAKQAEEKQALAERRRLDEEVNKLERRLESIEREFRKLLGVVRMKPLGKDRFYNRIWWFDGCGSSSLIGSGGAVQYGTGRIFIQGASSFDKDILDRRERAGEEINRRRVEEEGSDGILYNEWEWGVYTELEEIDAFVAWLNPKGVRELALKNALTKWWDHLAPGVRKRTADLSMNAKIPEARRSQRGKNANSDLSREPYMLWTNRKAVN